MGICQTVDMADPTITDVITEVRALRADVATVKLQSAQQTALLSALIAGQQVMANTLDSVISDLNTNTNTVAARIDALIAQIGDNVTPAQTATLQAISDHLKALGANPTTPVPPVPSAVTA